MTYAIRTDDWWASFDEIARRFAELDRERPTAPLPCACGNPGCEQGATVIRSAHGTVGRYLRHKCRCEPCTVAHQKYRVSLRLPEVTVCGCKNPSCTRRTRRAVTHGLSCYFRHKCRCGVCMEGMRAYQRERRARVRSVAATVSPATATALEVGVLGSENTTA